MNTTIKSLQDLYVKLGGSLSDTYTSIANGVPVSDYVTIPDMVEAVTQKAGSGSSLPAVTAEDNDKVLAVVNGVWDKSEMGGVVTINLVRADASHADVFLDRGNEHISATYDDVYDACLGSEKLGGVYLENAILHFDGYLYAANVGELIIECLQFSGLYQHGDTEAYHVIVKVYDGDPENSHAAYGQIDAYKIVTQESELPND